MVSLLCITLISLTLAGTSYSQPPNPNSLMTVMVFAEPGSNVTMPCRLPDPDGSAFGIRVKWGKLADDGVTYDDVLVSMGFHIKTYGNFEDRAFLQQEDSDDGSVIITDVSVKDNGKYRCEIVNGVEDIVQEITLEVQGDGFGLNKGVVFPYSPSTGRYNLNFHDAVKACEDQDAVVATFDQLFEAWKGGLDWCNAGWLNDSTVQYPITKPREPCGGTNSGPGVRNYGRRDRHRGRYDVFCHTAELKGHLYWLVQPDRLTFDEATQACLDDGAEIAKVGQMYAAWKLKAFDRCDAGWLADGSVRYPIAKPRKNCSPTEAAVRFVSFPDKQVKSYGVYCYRADQ